MTDIVVAILEESAKTTIKAEAQDWSNIIVATVGAIAGAICSVVAAIAGIRKYRECRRKCCTEPKKRVLRMKKDGPKK